MELEVHYCVHNSTPLDRVLSKSNPLQVLDPLSLRYILILSSRLNLGLPIDVFLSSFQSTFNMYLSPPSSLDIALPCADRPMLDEG
jgi:hypothetical protein